LWLAGFCHAQKCGGFLERKQAKEKIIGAFSKSNFPPASAGRAFALEFLDADNGKKAAPHNFTPLATQKLCVRFLQ
jgi:hypothetical protein